MTAKEKAIKLQGKFLIRQSFKEQNNIRIHQAGQCALIAVDEIITALIDYGTNHSDELQNMDRTLNYWNAVKTEITNI